MSCCEIVWIYTTCCQSPKWSAVSTRETRPLERAMMSVLQNEIWVKMKYSVLMGIHQNFKAIIAALDQNSDRIIDIIIIIYTPTFSSASEHIYNKQKVTYGPSCSRASQQNGNLKILKPQPFNLARWTSALPSSKLNGRPMKESFSFSFPLDLSFPPPSSSTIKQSSTASQNPSFFQLS